MVVDSGLVPFQVVQCDDAGYAGLACAGSTAAEGAGTVEARVLPAGAQDAAWTAAGTYNAGRWSVTMPGVPAGGPYALELRLLNDSGETVASAGVDNLLVGDLWILGGQSNMHGRGWNVNVEQPIDHVHVFAMNDRWRIAEEPIHRITESVDFAHNPIEDDAARQNLEVELPADWRRDASLGLAFGKEMYARTGRPVGLIPCAHGGTSIAQWSPALKEHGGRSLYGSMLRRFQAVGGKVRGMLWYQGENDCSPEQADVFQEQTLAFVEAVRADFGQPNLPFYFAQLGRRVNHEDPPTWNRIQRIQLAMEQLVRPPAGLAATHDLELGDYIHISTDGLKTLARRFANLAMRDLYGSTGLFAGPRISTVTWGKSVHGRQLVVTLDGVNGRVRSEGRMHGFDVTDGDGNVLEVIFRQEPSPENPNAVLLWLIDSLPEGSRLWYGLGDNPYCNVVDEAGMALPASGPIPIPAN